jgi:DNA-binding CsgD family transcriptional regulator
MKLALMQGRRPKETPVPSRSRASAYLVSQSFAWSAIVNAVYGETPSASDELADRAVALCDAPYVRNVAAFARAIAQQRLELDGASRRLADATLQTIESGDVYSLVLLYRSWPGVISIALEDPRTRGAMTEIVGRFDPDLARAHSAGEGTEERPSAASRLSPRECEVLELLTDGLTNREIASLLFIAESTAKLHVRHICRKLGVRSRTEAVLQATGQPEVRQPSA